jgi:hypothetical protein
VSCPWRPRWTRTRTTTSKTQHGHYTIPSLYLPIAVSVWRDIYFFITNGSCDIRTNCGSWQVYQYFIWGRSFSWLTGIDYAPCHCHQCILASMIPCVLCIFKQLQFMPIALITLRPNPLFPHPISLPPLCSYHSSPDRSYRSCWGRQSFLCYGG